MLVCWKRDGTPNIVRPLSAGDVALTELEHSADMLATTFEAQGLPFAPITRPEELLDDPHLNASGGLAPITLPDGRETKTVLMPVLLDGQRLGVRLSPPKLGEHNGELLAALGYSPQEIAQLSQPT